MKPNKFYFQIYNELSKYLDIGRKFDECECIIHSKQDNKIIVEACDYHTNSISNGSIKYISPISKPAFPKTTIASKSKTAKVK